jgi:hypothetical protein
MRVVDHEAIAQYFQQQANRARDQIGKAHYQRRADEYRAKAKKHSKPRLERLWCSDQVHHEVGARVLPFLARQSC